MPDVPEWFDLDRDEPEDKPRGDASDDRIYFLKSDEGFRGVWSRERFNAVWQRIAGTRSKASITPPPVWWYVNADESE